MTERGTLLRTVRKRLKLRQGDVAERAGYTERTYRRAETSGKNVSDTAWCDFAETLRRALPPDDPLVAALDQILKLAGPPERPTSYLEAALAAGEQVASRQFGLGPLLAVFLLGCAVGVGLLSAALWVMIHGRLGGSQEPHGVVAVLWLVATAGPVLAFLGLGLYYGRQEKTGPLTVDLGCVLLGGALGTWLFYSLPLFGPVGVRALLGGWPARPREYVLVVIWSLLIAGGGFGLQQLTAWFRRGTALRQHTLWRIALVVLVTSVPVWAFVARFGDGQEGARGIVAGIALRFGLALAVLFQPSAAQEAEEPRPSRGAGGR